MRAMILDYKREMNLALGPGNWKIKDKHTGDVVCSAATPREAVEKASEVYKSCSIDYSDAALAVLQKMAGDA